MKKNCTSAAAAAAGFQFCFWLIAADNNSTSTGMGKNAGWKSTQHSVFYSVFFSWFQLSLPLLLLWLLGFTEQRTEQCVVCVCVCVRQRQSGWQGKH